MGQLCPKAKAIMVSDLPARKDEITVRLYKHIQGLNDIYSEVVQDGLCTIAFPSIGVKEDIEEPEIQEFITNEGFTITVLQKVSVRGDSIHPLFKWLQKVSGLPEGSFWKTHLLNGQGKWIAVLDPANNGPFFDAMSDLLLPSSDEYEHIEL